MTSTTTPSDNTDTFASNQETRQQALQLLNKGAGLLRSQRTAEALPILQQAYELQPDDPDIAFTLGGALIMANKWSKAVTLLEQAVEQHPDNAQLWFNLAAAYLGRLELSPRSRQDQAIEAYKRVIELDPVAHSAQYNIGLIYAEQESWEEATEWFQTAIRANPNDQDAAYWLKKARVAQLQNQDS